MHFTRLVICVYNDKYAMAVAFLLSLSLYQPRYKVPTIIFPGTRDVETWKLTIYSLLSSSVYWLSLFCFCDVVVVVVNCKICIPFYRRGLNLASQCNDFQETNHFDNLESLHYNCHSRYHTHNPFNLIKMVEHLFFFCLFFTHYRILYVCLFHCF